MAASPSASTISTSAEAFKYPLPSVRQFHKQLQVALDEKNARLRTLVGGSYRQLLGTAEMIVDMRRDIGVAESKLGRVAEGCGRSAVSKRVAGLGALHGSGIRTDKKTGNADLGWIARIKVLGGCVIVVGRLLKGKDVAGLEKGQIHAVNLTTAAKVLVLSRLLVKNLGDDLGTGGIGVEDAEELLEEMRVKLGSLRIRLLRQVEKVLEENGVDPEGLAQALAAYSLATSSGAKDVMRHFLHVRGEAMALAFEEEEDVPRKESKENGLLRALRLYTRTLLDVQALVPRRLSDSLLNLKAKPLLRDSAIRNLEGLRLDVCQRWFGDEIMFFTPYIRHDDLDGPQAADALRGWAKKAAKVLLQGFETTLGLITEFKLVVGLRSKVLETWILEGGKAKGFDSSLMLDGLRKVINERLVNIVQGRVSKLRLVGTEIEATLGTWASISTEMHQSLWGDELMHMDLNSGAGKFKQSIIAQVYGRSNTVSRVINGFETWLHLTTELSVTIEQLKTQRWEDDLESLEDDLSLEKRGTLLSKDDPKMLQDHLEDCLDHAFKELHQKIAAQLATNKESEHIGDIAKFLLRVIRDIRAELPKAPDLKFFGLSLVPELHSILVSTVSLTALEAYTKSVSQRKSVAGRALWEGTPELPIQPSPPTFRLLHRLASSMMTSGNDLWSSAAVSVLRHHLRSQLGQQWLSILKKNDFEDGPQANGHKDQENEIHESTGMSTGAHIDGGATIKASDPPIHRDIIIQSLFDVLILKSSFPSTTIEPDELDALETSLVSRVELSPSSIKHLQAAAAEYWKRTSLLFGILA